MAVLLAPVLVLWLALPVAVALVPPVVAACYRRPSAPAAALYVLALALVVGFGIAADAHMDEADRTGGEGSIFAGALWLGAAAVAATTSVLVTVRPRAEIATR